MYEKGLFERMSDDDIRFHLEVERAEVNDPVRQGWNETTLLIQAHFD